MNHAARQRISVGPRDRSSGFTIAEMVVVITIIVLLLAVTVPAFRTMIRSSEETLAESLLRGAVRAGKDAAVRLGAPGRDTGVVFLYESGGRLTIVPVIQAGQLVEKTIDTSDDLTRDVFVPAQEFQPVRLPKNWMVRGFAPANSIGASTPDWYSPSTDSGSRYKPSVSNWVFPETDFYNRTRNNDGIKRNSFMIRFEGGSGITKPGGGSLPALVVIPRPSFVDRDLSAPSAYRFDQSDDYVKTAQAILNGTSTIAEKQKLLGRKSSDVVLARPVSQIVLYDESRLVAGLNGASTGTRIELERNGTGTIYKDPGATLDAPPTYITGITGANLANLNRWLEGNTNLTGATDATDQPESKIYTIDRYTASLRLAPVQKAGN